MCTVLELQTIAKAFVLKFAKTYLFDAKSKKFAKQILVYKVNILVDVWNRTKLKFPVQSVVKHLVNYCQKGLKNVHPFNSIQCKTKTYRDSVSKLVFVAEIIIAKVLKEEISKENIKARARNGEK